MLVATILKSKGTDVVTIHEGSTMADLCTLLMRRRIGAALVVDAKGGVVGIVSERDVVSAVSRRGSMALTLPVRDLMSAEVETCRPDEAVDALMVRMTEQRVRHLPVLDQGHLAGIISIGDVVKSRIGELETEHAAMQAYIASG